MSVLIGLVLVATAPAPAASAAPIMTGAPPAWVRQGELRRSRPDATAPSRAMRMTSHAIMMPWSDTPMPRTAPGRADAAPGRTERTQP